jgi:hypothetical protein
MFYSIANGNEVHTPDYSHDQSRIGVGVGRQSGLKLMVSEHGGVDEYLARTVREARK